MLARKRSFGIVQSEGRGRGGFVLSLPLPRWAEEPSRSIAFARNGTIGAATAYSLLRIDDANR